MSTNKISPSSDAARNRMRAVRRQGTKAEMALRAALTSLGLRFEHNQRPSSSLRREADILFPHERIAIFVDGCFWHGCPIHGTRAKANAEFWQRKIERNKARDEETNEILSEEGWLVIRVWEHVDALTAAHHIAAHVNERSHGRHGGGVIRIG